MCLVLTLDCCNTFYTNGPIIVFQIVLLSIDLMARLNPICLGFAYCKYYKQDIVIIISGAGLCDALYFSMHRTESTAHYGNTNIPYTICHMICFHLLYL